jgi:hypothetical protein
MHGHDIVVIVVPTFVGQRREHNGRASVQVVDVDE